jgi:hypothetical protein
MISLIRFPAAHTAEQRTQRKTKSHRVRRFALPPRETIVIQFRAARTKRSSAHKEKHKTAVFAASLYRRVKQTAIKKAPHYWNASKICIAK